MRAARGAVLVPLLLVLSMPPTLAARRPISKKEEAAQARREENARQVEDARATRLAELLILEEQERLRRQHEAEASRPRTRVAGRTRPVSGPGIPAPRSRPIPGETRAADGGLDTVFGRDEPVSATDTSREYPTAIVPSSQGAYGGDNGSREPASGLSATPREADAFPALSPAAPPPASLPGGDAGDVAGAGSTPGAGVELFHQGYSAFSKGDLEGARRSFRRFMAENPGHDLSDNAQYWMGESWADQGRLEEALAAYQVVIDHFPFGDKVPEALLKSGYALADLGREAEARERLQQVVEDFPGTGPARRAAERLGAR